MAATPRRRIGATSTHGEGERPLATLAPRPRPIEGMVHPVSAPGVAPNLLHSGAVRLRPLAARHRVPLKVRFDIRHRKVAARRGSKKLSGDVLLPLRTK
jgi:hypothetical protein